MGTASLVAVTTTLAASSGGISALAFSFMISEDDKSRFDTEVAINGVLAGLVSVTAGCSVVTGGSSIAIGCIGGLLYLASSKLIAYLKIDDPLDAFPVHGVCGAWGVMAAGMFSTQELIGGAYDTFVAEMSWGKRFSGQLIEVLAVMAWTVTMAGAMFFAIDKILGMRVSDDEESMG